MGQDFTGGAVKKLFCAEAEKHVTVFFLAGYDDDLEAVALDVVIDDESPFTKSDIFIKEVTEVTDGYRGDRTPISNTSPEDPQTLDEWSKVKDSWAEMRVEFEAQRAREKEFLKRQLTLGF